MNGDTYRRVLSTHKDAVHRYAAYVLADAEEAADVTQQAFVRLWERRSDVPESSTGLWLRRTAHRICLDRLRRRGVRRETTFDEFAGANGNGHATGHGGDNGHEFRRAVVDSLMRLDARDRALLALRDMDGLSYEQIAAVLAMPMGTLKTALHRARERLRKSLAASGISGQ